MVCVCCIYHGDVITDFYLACNTNYHYNFFVRSGVRHYYGGMPAFVQVGEHQFVQREVLELFTAQTVHSWTSATNASRIYDVALSRNLHASAARFSLTTEQVLDGFILNALIRDCNSRGDRLHLPHTGDQKDRFTQAMQDRNNRIRLAGQPEWAHYCERCTRRYQDSQGGWSTC